MSQHKIKIFPVKPSGWYQVPVQTCAGKCTPGICESPKIIKVKSNGNWYPFICGACSRVKMSRTFYLASAIPAPKKPCTLGQKKHAYETVFVPYLGKYTLMITWCGECGLVYTRNV